MTASAFYIDSNEVISNTRELKNITSLDATTTATIESAIAAAPNDFNTLNVTGVSTLASSGGITTTGGDLYSGVASGMARHHPDFRPHLLPCG